MVIAVGRAQGSGQIPAIDAIATDKADSRKSAKPDEVQDGMDRAGVGVQLVHFRNLVAIQVKQLFRVFVPPPVVNNLPGVPQRNPRRLAEDFSVNRDNGCRFQLAVQPGQHLGIMCEEKGFGTTIRLKANGIVDE